MADGLSAMEREAVFAREFVKDLNATQAAVRSGYSAPSAYSAAHRLLRKPRVREQITRLAAANQARVELEADNILRELLAIATADVADYVTKNADSSLALRQMEEIPPLSRRAIADVRRTKDGFRLKLHPKLPALALLAKHVGLLVERHEVSGPGGAPVAIEGRAGLSAATVDLLRRQLLGIKDGGYQ